MSYRKISELPNCDAAKLASEAEQKGKAALAGTGLNAELVILIGLCQIVSELRDKVQQLESKPKVIHPLEALNP